MSWLPKMDWLDELKGNKFVVGGCVLAALGGIVLYKSISAKKKCSGLKVGGVPEHFNFPWTMGIQDGTFKNKGVDIDWVTVKEGTGAMISRLKSKELDVVVALTEGLVKEIALTPKDAEDRVQLIGVYVSSPLCWAVSVGKNARFNTVDDLKEGSFAVSRPNSGSHLMTQVMAMERGWDLNKLTYLTRGDFTKLRNAVNDTNDESDAFIWETFTTKPFHDSKEIKRVGECVTPWPAFMIATLKSSLDNPEKLEAIKLMLAGIREKVQEFHNTNGMSEIVAREFKLKREDAKQWYSNVSITADSNISKKVLVKTVSSLIRANMLGEECAGIDLSYFVGESVANLA